MEVKEFQEQALRTESKVDTVNVNIPLLLTVLQLIANLNDILDGLKKSIYYNDDDKLKELKDNKLLQGVLINTHSLMYEQLNNYESKKELSYVDSRVLHGIMGISTESGELIEALLKSTDGRPIDAVNVSEEMHDISWYMAVLNDVLTLDWNEGLSNLITKLKIRFPEKYTNEKAANRDLDTERKALEGKL